MPSLTPHDAGCQHYISEMLNQAGFKSEHLQFEDVSNLWSLHGKESKPLFVFLGHTDVVPIGRETDWQFPPFEATEHEGHLYGRGAADMKGCIAAFIAAALDFVAEHPEHKGSLAILLTSDEEGIATNGTVKVIEEFQKRNLKIDYCLVGEPSSEERLGDVVKVGRRGSLSGRLQIYGSQGHVAYPHLADNPIHKALAALKELCEQKWDEGNEFFPATSFQISNINAGTGADNVIPGQLDLVFNFRYSSESNAEQLKSSVEKLLERHRLNYRLDWRLSGLPFLTGSGDLVDAIKAAIEEKTGSSPRLLTTGGTSDGRFVAPTGSQVAEFGLINRTIHKVDECTRIEDLNNLKEIYQKIVEKILL